MKMKAKIIGGAAILVIAFLAAFAFKGKTGTSENNIFSTRNVVKEKLTVTPYKNWLEKKGKEVLQTEKKVEDYTFSALYRPVDYLALADMANEPFDEQRFKKKKEQYEGLQYFTFKISAEGQNTELLKVNLKSKDDYYKRIEYFSFKMQNDLKLIENSDTLDCVLFHFERVYNIAPYALFTVAFPEGNTNTDKTIFYDDNILGVGRIFLKVKAENINAIPELTTK